MSDLKAAMRGRVEETLVRVEELLYQDFGSATDRGTITERLRQVSGEMEEKLDKAIEMIEQKR